MYFSKEYQNGEIVALYTGRFAYICSGDKDEAMEVFDRTVNNGEDVYKDMLEEFNHYKLFIRTASGLYINGLRWLIRLLYNISGSKLLVCGYYKIRSIFYCMSYDFHEKNVNCSKISQLRILYLDVKIFIQLSSCSVQFLLTIPLVPLIITFGYILSKHFTLRVPSDEPGEFKEVNISNSAYVGEVPNRNRSILIHLNKIIQIEKYFPPTDKLTWFLCKFKTEKEVWECYSRKFEFCSSISYEDYIGKVIYFIERWSRVGTNIPPLLIKEELLYPDLSSLIDFNSNYDLSLYTWFFYQHGN